MEALLDTFPPLYCTFSFLPSAIWAFLVGAIHDVYADIIAFTAVKLGYQRPRPQF